MLGVGLANPHPLPLTIEDMEKQLKKRILHISELEKENDRPTAENQKMKEVLKEIRSKLRELGELGTMV